MKTIIITTAFFIGSLLAAQSSNVLPMSAQIEKSNQLFANFKL
jgi:hypothetical protein